MIIIIHVCGSIYGTHNEASPRKSHSQWLLKIDTFMKL